MVCSILICSAGSVSPLCFVYYNSLLSLSDTIVETGKAYSGFCVVVNNRWGCYPIYVSWINSAKTLFCRSALSVLPCISKLVQIRSGRMEVARPGGGRSRQRLPDDNLTCHICSDDLVGYQNRRRLWATMLFRPSPPLTLIPSDLGAAISQAKLPRVKTLAELTDKLEIRGKLRTQYQCVYLLTGF